MMASGMRTNCTRMAAVVGLWLGCATPASATIVTPTTTADDLSNNGNCTLREAIQAANTDTAVDQCPAGSGADVIKLGPNTYALSLTGARDDANATGDLDVTGPLTIEGTTSGAPTTIDAQSIDRAIDVQAGAPATIENLTITGGRAPNGLLLGANGLTGGAIRAQSALTLTDVNIVQSQAGSGNVDTTGLVGGPGGTGHAGGDGGGVWTNAQLTVTGGSFTS